MLEASGRPFPGFGRVLDTLASSPLGEAGPARSVSPRVSGGINAAHHRRWAAYALSLGFRVYRVYRVYRVGGLLGL